ncbi:hypothetical protein ACPXCE_26820 [Streptomyces sp. DT24]|uniref:hypothetical protein n=1 Tax=unclassified Streptomyces TaxID=2593676 RepID=UPI0023B8B50F|nr:hypothetical protein [Streptomyces sp. AM 4-1-1]WEH32264.1 hypothetical protein PZB75_02045 [Streptomyces sp. AM 4-1-1]
MSNSETEELLRVIERLGRCVDSLRSRTGESAMTLRLVNTVERLRIDAADLYGVPRPLPAGDGLFVAVPDDPYDPGLWHGADDEGVGGHRPHLPTEFGIIS